MNVDICALFSCPPFFLGGGRGEGIGGIYSDQKYLNQCIYAAVFSKDEIYYFKSYLHHFELDFLEVPFGLKINDQKSKGWV